MINIINLTSVSCIKNYRIMTVRITCGLTIINCHFELSFMHKNNHYVHKMNKQFTFQDKITVDTIFISVHGKDLNIRIPIETSWR
jgi:hypothetical protein